jgi:hypothetical protein
MFNVKCVHCTDIKMVTPGQRAVHLYDSKPAMRDGLFDVLWHYKLGGTGAPTDSIPIDEWGAMHTAIASL